MRTRTVWLCLVYIALMLGLLGYTAGCGGGFLSSLGIGSGRGGGGQPVHPAGGLLGPREEFAHLLGQLQWIFIGLGIAGVVASIWVPLISTRHAVGALAIGIGIAFLKPFIIALYWPTVICLALAALAACWPYLVAGYAWVRTRFLGKPAPPATVGVVASLKSLVLPRAVAARSNARGGGLPVGADAPDTDSSRS